MEKKPRNIWYISKYAANPFFDDPGRQFFFAKYMAKSNRDLTLISSRSSAGFKIPSLGMKNQIYYEFDGVKGVLLNGPIINPGFNLKRVYSWAVFELRLLYWALLKRKQRPNVIIVSSLSILTFLTGVLLKRYFKCKLICEVRDIWPLTIIETKNWKNSNLFIKFLAYVERIGYKYADAIVGTMPNLKEHVAIINPLYASKVAFIPTGFDPDYWGNDITPDDENSFADVFRKIPDDHFIVGYSGTIGLVNCVCQIVDAAAILKGKPISFLILGNGVLKDELENKVKNLGLKNVHFLDPVPKKKVSRFLEKCHLLLNPWKGGDKIYRYGVSPNKWIDYMYSARPIIVSLDGFPSIINEAGCGVFIKADDVADLAKTIEEFYCMDRKKLDQMGAAGKAYLLNNLTYERLTEKYLKIIDDLN